MAKLTTLEIYNGILRNCGEQTVASLASLSAGLQTVAWDKLSEALVEICTDQNTRWQFLEAFGIVTLSTNNYRYLISSLTTPSAGSDMQREDRESFIQPDSGNRIKYLTPQEWDRKYPKGIETAMTGYPTEYTKFAGYLIFNKYATASENGDLVNFRYWKHPTMPATGSPNATLDIPEPFDRLVLIPLATMKTMVYLGNDEAAAHRVTVFGNGQDIEGNLAKLHEIYGSPELKPRVSFNA